MFLNNLRAACLTGLCLLMCSSASGGEKLSYLNGQYTVERSESKGEWDTDTLTTPKGTLPVLKKFGQVRGVLKCGNMIFVVSQFAVCRYNERAHSLHQLSISEGSNVKIAPYTFTTFDFTDRDLEFATIDEGPPDERIFFVQILATMKLVDPNLEFTAASETPVPAQGSSHLSGGDRVTMVVGIVYGTTKGNSLTRHYYEMTGLKRSQERKIASWEWVKDEESGQRHPVFNLNQVDPGVLRSQWTMLTLQNLKTGKLKKVVTPTPAERARKREEALAKVKASPE